MIDPFSLALIGGGVGSFLSDIFGGDDTDTRAFGTASRYLNKIPEQVKPYYDPYIQSGQRALETSEGTFADLLKDPGKILEHIGSGFEPSKGYKWTRDQALEAINNSQASGGMLNTPQHQRYLMDTASGLAGNEYYDKYMPSAMGLYGQGLSGLGGLTSLGYDAGTSLADILKDIGLSGANLGYSTEINKGTRRGNMFGNLGSTLGFLGGALAKK